MRILEGRNPAPSAGVIDAQSVKTSADVLTAEHAKPGPHAPSRDFPFHCYTSPNSTARAMASRKSSRCRW
ncbi:hypothetical protein GCM10022214_01880 [Actinomadura miaoliensis]|uniref:Uncharacterized protein n=1 Tax=Actinomadura miaoliensis TaxID=430685 RepID=A0ABP7UWW6_9ACTN